MRAGRWALLRPLGRGGMGEVWLGRDEGGQEAAVKLLPPDALDAEHRLRFAREAQTLRALRHPGIAAWLDAGEEQGRPWIAMELVPGPTLEALVEKRGPLPPREAVALAIDVAVCLAAAHAAGVLHRDVKPGNVLLGADGRPRLLDFGLGRPVQRGASLTASGTIMGSPGYLAPEQVTGEKAKQGNPTDVYGLGATLYFLLAGVRPFAAPSVMACLEAVLRDPPAPLASRRADVPPELELIVVRCLAKSPLDRYPSAMALRDALAGWLASPPARSTARWRPLLAAVAVLPLAIVAVLLLPGLTPDAAPPMPAVPASSTPTPDGPAPQRAPDLVARGLACLSADDYDGALQAAGEAIVLDPKLAGAHYVQGAARWRLEGPGAAMADLNRAIELDSQDARAIECRARVLLEQDRAGEAVADFDRVLAIDPRSSGALFCRARAHASLDQIDRALADYDAFIALCPESTEAFTNRGGLRGRRGDPPETEIEDYDRAIALDPHNVLALCNRGLARAKLGKFREAVGDFDAALEADPEGELAPRLRELRDQAEGAAQRR